MKIILRIPPSPAPSIRTVAVVTVEGERPFFVPGPKEIVLEVPYGTEVQIGDAVYAIEKEP